MQKSNFDLYDISLNLSSLLKEYAKDASLHTKPPQARHNLYLAGPWFDDKAMQLCRFVEDTILAEYDGTEHNVFMPRMGGESGQNPPGEVFRRNVDEVNNCYIVLAMVSRKDVGTAWEIGMAYALGKEVVLLGYDETDFTVGKTNAMLAFCGKCITLNNLVKWLRGTIEPHEYFKFDSNNWEGIE